MTTTPTAPLTLDAAPEQLKVVAWRYQVGRTVHLCASQLDHYFSVDEGDSYIKGAALCLLTEAQSALSAQAATIAQLEARLREAEADARRMDALEGVSVENQWIVAKNLDSFTASLGRPRHATRRTLREAIDAAIAAHGKDGAHDC